MRIAPFCLLLLAAPGLAASPGYRRVPETSLWVSGELPVSWESEGPGTRAYKPKTGGGELVLSYASEGDALKHVQETAEPSAGQRDARRVTEFRGSPPDHRGQWVLAETYEKNAQGREEYAVEAALPARGGGFYSASYWAADAASFKRGRPVFEHWLDTFRRDYPAPRFAAYEGAVFSVDAPTSPWSRESEPSTGETFFFAPGGPGDQARGVLKIQWFSGNPLFANAEAFAKAEGRSTPAHKAGPITRRRLPSGDALAFDVDVLARAEKYAERAAGDNRLLFRWAVIQRKDGFAAVSWMAPPASFEDGLPAFERALATLRFAKP